MKRIAAALLWGYTFWSLGAMASFFLALSDLLGPFLGLTGGLMIGIDPRHLIWARDRATRAAAQPSPAAPSAA